MEYILSQQIVYIIFLGNHFFFIAAPPFFFYFYLCFYYFYFFFTQFYKCFSSKTLANIFSQNSQGTKFSAASFSPYSSCYCPYY